MKMAKKKVKRTYKKKAKPVVQEVVETPVQMPKEEASQNVTERFNPISLKRNHARQSEVNNRVQLVMSFNPQIAKLQPNEWSCTIGYDNESGLYVTGSTPLDAVMNMFNELT
jgi:polyhydroxyalkanoate synthesis regulator phasin